MRKVRQMMMRSNPGTRARISTLIAGLHGVDTAADDEICNGDEVSCKWYPETHMNQKMVIEGKTQIQENEGVPCCHKRIHETGTKKEK